MQTQTTLVQAKGQVTIPAEIRERLQLKKGDRVAFIETENGVFIQPAEVVISAAFNSIGKELEKKELSLEQLIESGRNFREDLLEEEYKLGKSNNR
jgi:AbrB family looped-hinge helix DNA binding protein